MIEKKNEDPFQEKAHPQEEGDKKEENPTKMGVWTFKNGGLKPVLNFIGLAISTWDPVLNLPNDSSVEIPVSIDWTRLPNNTTLITAALRICKTSGKPIPR